MKVAIVARIGDILPTPKTHTWAPGVVIWNEARVLDKLGVGVRVYCAKGSKVAGEVVDFDMPSSANAFGALGPEQKGIRDVFYNDIYQFKVIEHLRKYPVDIIHLHDYRTYPPFKEANLGIPTVVTLHGDYFHNFDQTPGVIKDDVNAMKIIAIGQTPKVPKGIKPPIAVIPNILDLGRFKFIAKPKNRVVYVGRLRFSKGPDLAIEAARLAGVKIGLYGAAFGGKNWEAKMHKLFDKNPHAAYYGHLPYEEVYQAFDARALLLPIREPEGFGNVIIESMASGTPVIAFSLGSTENLIKDGVNGFLVEPGNIKQMAQVIKRIDEIDRTSCRQYTLERFDEDKLGQKFIKVFQKVINRI